jgi:hypothetical protein
MIYPDNKYKNPYDLFVALVLIFSCLLSPLYIAFESENEEKKIGWEVVNWSIDGVFLIDIFVMFFSAFYDEDFRIVDDYKILSKNYLTGWFCIDVLAIIPFDLFLSSSSETSADQLVLEEGELVNAGSSPRVNQLVRIARVGRLYKLIKLTRLLRVIKIVKEQGKFFKFFTDVLKISHGFERLLFFILIFMMLVHISACLWIIIPQFSATEANNGGTWMEPYTES